MTDDCDPLAPGDHGDYTFTRHDPKPKAPIDIKTRKPKALTDEELKARFLTAARPLSYFVEFNNVVALDWVVKGIFAKGHTSYTFGPPGGGKSALLGSAASYLGAGMDWRGFKVRKPMATVYFALERADLVKKR